MNFQDLKDSILESMQIRECDNMAISLVMNNINNFAIEFRENDRADIRFLIKVAENGYEDEDDNDRFEQIKKELKPTPLTGSDKKDPKAVDKLWGSGKKIFKDRKEIFKDD